MKVNVEVDLTMDQIQEAIVHLKRSDLHFLLGVIHQEELRRDAIICGKMTQELIDSVEAIGSFGTKSKMIPAIRKFRELTGCTLYEAKKAWDNSQPLGIS